LNAFGRECGKGWHRLHGREKIQQLIEGARLIDRLTENAV
jgi:hypothetical protein